MLVLSRNAQQRIFINDNIEVVVIAVHGGSVKLGFTAPSDVSIHREEVRLRIQSECRDAGANVNHGSADGTSALG